MRLHTLGLLLSIALGFSAFLVPSAAKLSIERQASITGADSHYLCCESDTTTCNEVYGFDTCSPNATNDDCDEAGACSPGCVTNESGNYCATTPKFATCATVETDCGKKKTGTCYWEAFVGLCLCEPGGAGTEDCDGTWKCNNGPNC